MPKDREKPTDLSIAERVADLDQQILSENRIIRELKDSGRPLRQSMSDLEARYKAESAALLRAFTDERRQAEAEYMRLVGRELSARDNAVDQLVRERNRLAGSLHQERLITESRAEQVRLLEAFAKIKPIFAEKARMMSQSGDPLTNALGRVVGNVISKSPIAEHAYRIIEKDLSHFRYTSSGERILVGSDRQGGARLSLFMDGNFALTVHPTHVEDAKVISFTGVKTVDDLPESPMTLVPFKLEWNPYNIQAAPTETRLTGTELTRTMGYLHDALSQESISLRVNGKKLVVPNPQ